MPIQIKCPKCLTLLQLPDDAYGKQVRCPKCATVLQLPAAPAPPIPPAPVPARPPTVQPQTAVPPPLPRPVPAPAPMRPAPVPSAPPAAVQPAPLKTGNRADIMVPLVPSPAPAALQDSPKKPAVGLHRPLWILCASVAAVCLLVAVAILVARPWSRTTIQADPEDGRSANLTRQENPEDGSAGRTRSSGSGTDTETGKEPGTKIDRPGDHRDGPGAKELPPLPPLLPVSAERPRANTPLIFAQLSSLDEGLEGLRTLAVAVNRKKDFEEVWSKFKKTFSPEGVQGVDVKKPVGAYLQYREEDSIPTVILLLPVKEEAKFLRLLRDFGFKLKDRVRDLIPLEPPEVPPDLPVKLQLPKLVYVRLAHGYAHLCLSGDPNLLSGEQLLPSKQVLSDRGKKFLSATFRIDRVQPKLRQVLLDRADEIKNQLPPTSSGAVKAFADKLTELLVGYTKDLVKGGRNLSLDLELDAKKQTIAADLYLQGKKDSPLEANIAALSKTPSTFAGLALEEAAATVLVNVRFPQELRKLLPGVVQAATDQALADEKDASLRKQAERLFKAVGPTFAAGELDLAGAIRSNGKGKPASLVAGLKVAKGKELDRVFQQAVLDYDNKDFSSLFEMKAIEVGDVKAHRFNGQKQLPEELLQVFGDNPFYYGFRTDRVCYTAGANGQQWLRRALEARPRPSPLALISGNVKQLIELIPVRNGDVELSRKVLTVEHPGRFRLELSAGSALRLHASVELSLIRFLSDRLEQSLVK